MHFKDLLFDTLRTLWSHKLRTFLTMFGIAWGIVSMVLMVAAGEGMAVGQRRAAETMGKDIMIVFPGRTSLHAGGMRAGRLIRFDHLDHTVVIPQAPSCRYVLPELGNNQTVRSAFNSASLLVTGSHPAFAEIRSLDVGSGRFYNEEDLAMGRRVAFIGSDVARQLFSERDPLGQSIQIGGKPYVIIGVLRAKEQDSSYDGQDVNKVFIPLTAMSRDFPDPPPREPVNIDRFIVTPVDLAHHEACKAEIRRALGRLHGFDPADEEAAGIWDTLENAKRFRTMTDGMKYFLGTVGITSLFLGGIGVMNIMLVAVRERTREIGVRKAVGATSRSILRQFFVETMIVVFVSGGAGLAIAYGFCAAVNFLFFRAPSAQSYFAGLLPSAESGLLAFGLLGTVAILSALYPAHRAASVDPIEALRCEAGS